MGEFGPLTKSDAPVMLSDVEVEAWTFRKASSGRSMRFGAQSCVGN